MKTYVKAMVVAKNNPEGSYAAGCPADKNWTNCENCERTK